MWNEGGPCRRLSFRDMDDLSVPPATLADQLVGSSLLSRGAQSISLGEWYGLIDDHRLLLLCCFVHNMPLCIRLCLLLMDRPLLFGNHGHGRRHDEYNPSTANSNNSSIFLMAVYSSSSDNKAAAKIVSQRAREDILADSRT